MEGVWATIFICHLILGGHLLNIPISTEIFSKCYQPANSYTKSCELVGFFVSFPLLYSSEKNGCLLHLSDKHPNKIVKVRNTLFSLLAYKQPGIFIFQIFP